MVTAIFEKVLRTSLNTRAIFELFREYLAFWSLKTVSEAIRWKTVTAFDLNEKMMPFFVFHIIYYKILYGKIYLKVKNSMV